MPNHKTSALTDAQTAAATEPPAAPTIAWSHFALKALTQWMQYDRHGATAIATGDHDTLRRLMTFYTISRNFHGINTDGKRKQLLTYVQAAAKAVSRSACTSQDVVKAVNKLAKKYDTKTLTSAASKLLYLAQQTKGVIYDRNAVRALGLKATITYDTFVEAWLSAFESHKPAIKQARLRCLALADDLFPLYLDSAESCRTVLSQAWFDRRIFDIYLWHLGAGQ